MKCLICNGAGRGHLWKDRDPIEGSKMAPRYPCLFCDGDGKIPDNDVRAVGLRAYDDAMRSAEEERRANVLRKAAELDALIKSARAKLTQDELNALEEAMIQ